MGKNTGWMLLGMLVLLLPLVVAMLAARNYANGQLDLGGNNALMLALIIAVPTLLGLLLILSSTPGFEHLGSKWAFAALGLLIFLVGVFSIVSGAAIVPDEGSLLNRESNFVGWLFASFCYLAGGAALAYFSLKTQKTKP